MSNSGLLEFQSLITFFVLRKHPTMHILRESRDSELFEYIQDEVEYCRTKWKLDQTRSGQKYRKWQF